MKKLIPLLLLLVLALPLDMAWGQQIGTTALPFTADEVHILPQPDTTKIYLHYADGGCDTISVLPARKKSKYLSSNAIPYAVATMAAQTQREAITWAELEAFLADTLTMDSVYVKPCTGVYTNDDRIMVWGPGWVTYKYPKTLAGLMAWRRGR